MGGTLAKSDSAPFRDNPDAVLQELREDMELIAYVASHDLLAPLRIMAHAYETLKAKPDASPQERESLQMLEEEMARLKALLHGLQDYVRLGVFTLKHVPLDTVELVDAAIEALGEEIRTAGARVTRDALPKVMGHRGRLNCLFAHLIGNAVKFHGEQPPKVHISAKRTGSGIWTFCVEDNGLGVDEELQEPMFRLFQRLHPAESYPGYGIGLALSRKIVASHGGKLWVESAPGKGSRFFFTLPSAEN